MGNTVSAAERLAEGIVHPVTPRSEAPTKPHHSVTATGSPPPECPMHQKDEKPQAVVVKSECPLGHDKDQVNPLNMVRKLN